MTAPVVLLHGALGSRVPLAPLAEAAVPGHDMHLAGLPCTPHPCERVPLDRLAASVSAFLAAD